ncbi:uncharacterized protein LOC112492650 [Ziziphus jujuba]|uniref:Uncharacterized protein LOC112492650 n=1 Tax=Ziziphus jujuba TaxID=326968 RepID=A0A6P6GG27_ZIZJJ|nr:uncharacterized protein LOC112492650 [Ziziphus jujuba]
MKQTTLEGKNGDHKEENEALAKWDCGSPLYDSYELVSLNHLIERHLMAIPSLGGSRRFISQFSHPSCGVIINPSTTVDLGSTKVAKWSSMVACLSEFVGRKVWKKRLFGERKDKVKKLKLIRPLGSCSSIGFGRK